MAVTLEQLKKGAEGFFSFLSDEAKKAGSAIELYALHLAHTLEDRHGEIAGPTPTPESEPESEGPNTNTYKGIQPINVKENS